MGNERINGLSNQGTYDADMYVEVDKSTLPAAKKMKLSVVLSDEETAREAQDDVIEAGAGLETDGTYATNEGSNYLKAADFAGAGTTPSLKEADNLLDAELAALAATVAGNAVMTTTTITIPNASLKGLNAVPYDLIGNAVDDLGLYYYVVGAIARLYYGTAAIEVGTEKLILRYSSGTQIGEWSNSFYESGADAIETCKISDNITVPETGSIQLYCGDNDAGTSTSTMKVTLIYCTLTI